MNYKIWLSLSDLDLAKKWAEFFTEENFECKIFETPSKYIDFLSSISAGADKLPAFSILQLHPKGYNQHMILEILQISSVPVIIASEPSSISNSLITEILLSGADDYITLTIDPRVLIAKIRAHIRRMEISLADKSSAHKLSTAGKEIILDFDSNSAAIKQGKQTRNINLTQHELQILTILIHNEGRIVERNDLLKSVWREKSEDINSQTLDKYIEMIRKKLETLGDNIKTVYGRGYMYKKQKRGTI